MNGGKRVRLWDNGFFCSGQGLSTQIVRIVLEEMIGVKTVYGLGSVTPMDWFAELQIPLDFAVSANSSEVYRNKQTLFDVNIENVLDVEEARHVDATFFNPIYDNAGPSGTAMAQGLMGWGFKELEFGVSNDKRASLHYTRLHDADFLEQLPPIGYLDTLTLSQNNFGRVIGSDSNTPGYQKSDVVGPPGSFGSQLACDQFAYTSHGHKFTVPVGPGFPAEIQNQTFYLCNDKGRFIPPQCQTSEPTSASDDNYNSTKCREIYTTHYFDMGWTFLAVLKYNFPVVVQFLTAIPSDFTSSRNPVIQALQANNQSFVMFAAEPEHTNLGLTPLVIKTHDTACQKGIASTSAGAYPDFALTAMNAIADGSREICDFPVYRFVKSLSNRLPHLMPAASYALRRFFLSQGIYEELFAMNTCANGYKTALPWYPIACQYVKANYAELKKKLLPECHPDDLEYKVSDGSKIVCNKKCPLTQYVNAERSQCFDCPMNTRQSASGLAPCVAICDAGEFYDVHAANGPACVSARPGKYAPEKGLLTDQDCADGYFSTGGAVLCEACPVGSVGTGEGKSECKECPEGQYADAPGTLSTRGCMECQPGTFSAFPKTSRCELCPVGEYNELPGQLSCKTCPVGESTIQAGSVSVSACQCPKGTFAACLPGAATAGGKMEAMSLDALNEHCGADKNASCYPCPEGMECNGFSVLVQESGGLGDLTRQITLGSYEEKKCAGENLLKLNGNVAENVNGNSNATARVLTNQNVSQNQNQIAQIAKEHCIHTPPLPKPGFWSGLDAVYVAYDCFYSKRCPGGQIAKCATAFEGFVCAKCGSGNRIRNSQENDLKAECVSCEESSVPYVVIPLLFIMSFFAAYGVYYFSAKNRQLMGRMAIAAAMGLMVQTLQYLSVFDKFSLSWGSPMGEILSALQFIAFDLNIIGAGCLFGNDPTFSSLARLFLPLYLILSMFITSKFLAPIGLFGKRFAIREFHFDSLINGIGLVWLVFFISLCLMVLSMIQCYSHPDRISGIGTDDDHDSGSSLRAFPEIKCGESDHIPLILIATVGFLAYILIPIIVVYKICEAVQANPKKNLNRVRHYFLVARYGVNNMHWTYLALMRSLGLAVIPMVLSNKGSHQLIVFSIFSAVWAIIVAAKRPWLSPPLNVLDVTILIVIALMSGWGFVYLPDLEGTGAEDTVMIGMVVLTILVFGFIVFILISFVLAEFFHVRNKKLVKYGMQPPEAGSPDDKRYKKTFAGIKSGDGSTISTANSNTTSGVQVGPDVYIVNHKGEVVVRNRQGSKESGSAHGILKSTGTNSDERAGDYQRGDYHKGAPRSLDSNTMTPSLSDYGRTVTVESEYGKEVSFKLDSIREDIREGSGDNLGEETDEGLQHAAGTASSQKNREATSSNPILAAQEASSNHPSSGQVQEATSQNREDEEATSHREHKEATSHEKNRDLSPIEEDSSPMKEDSSPMKGDSSPTNSKENLKGAHKGVEKNAGLQEEGKVAEQSQETEGEQNTADSSQEQTTASSGHKRESSGHKRDSGQKQVVKKVSRSKLDPPKSPPSPKAQRVRI